MPRKRAKNDSMKILVVDDDESIRKTLSMILGKNGFDISTADTGQQAIEIVQEAHHDLVLLDLRLPDMKGTDVLGALKSIDPDLPVFIITGYASPDSALLAMDRGAAGYIAKPFNMENLIERIELTLRRMKRPKKKKENTISNETVIRLLTDDLGQIQSDITGLKMDVVRLDTKQSYIKGTQLVATELINGMAKELKDYNMGFSKYCATTDERFKWQEKMQKLILTLVIFLIGLVLVLQLALPVPFP